MKVAVCGGGTGGHTLPALAVIKSLERIDPQAKIFFIGSRFGMESGLIPKIGIKYYGISSGKFRRYHKSMILNVLDPTTLIKNIRDFFNFLKGIKEARNILAHERPDVVFAKGGYVSLPVGYAAKLAKIPVIIHESDIVMGLANKRMARFAKRVCVSFPINYYPEIKKEKLIETGNPIREDLAGAGGAEFARKIQFDPQRKTILVIGGSQGSRFINETVLKIIDELLLEYQLLWITGEKDLDYVNMNINKLDENKRGFVKTYGFVTNGLSEIYDVSDAVVSRSGSNVIFELAALRKPMILVPIDDIAGGHQFENAKYFSRNGAAFTLRQKDLTPRKLIHQIRYIFENEKEISDMKAKAGMLSRPDASNLVAKEIYEQGVTKNG